MQKLSSLLLTDLGRENEKVFYVIGDLFLSATSDTSRNFAGGMAIARGEVPSGTVEGLSALRGLISRATRIGVDVPILRDMCNKMKL